MTAQLILTSEPANSICIRLESPSYQPEWAALVTIVAHTIFLNQPLCLVGDHPTEWGLELEALSDHFLNLAHADGAIGVGFIANPNPSQLEAILSSSDFQLGTVSLAQIQAEDAGALIEYIATWVQRGLDYVEHTKTIEWLECIDNHRLYWHNPSHIHQANAMVQLEDYATHHGWEYQSSL